MTKNAVAKQFSMYGWSDGTRRSKPEPDTPAWFSGSLNTWFSYATTIASAQSTADTGITAYSGGTNVGPIVIVNGGGHNDSSSNEVDAIDLSADAPAWTQLRARTASVTANVTHYGDGRPVSRHTGWDIQGIESKNKVFLFGGWARHNDANAVGDKIDAFDLSTNDWVTAGTYPDKTGIQRGNVPQPVCQDDSGNVYVWSLSSGGFDGTVYKWTASTETWSTLLTGGTDNGYNNPMAYDRTNNRLVIMRGTSNSVYIDLSDNSLHSITWTGAQSGSAQNSCSFFWCGDLFSGAGGFLMKPFGSSSFYQIHPTTFAITTYSLSGTAPTEAGDAGNNMYGRCGWISSLGIVYSIPQTSTNIAAFRTR